MNKIKVKVNTYIEYAQCSHCGGRLSIANDNVVYTTYPIKKYYGCEDCRLEELLSERDFPRIIYEEDKNV